MKKPAIDGRRPEIGKVRPGRLCTRTRSGWLGVGQNIYDLHTPSSSTPETMLLLDGDNGYRDGLPESTTWDSDGNVRP